MKIYKHNIILPKILLAALVFLFAITSITVIYAQEAPPANQTAISPSPQTSGAPAPSPTVKNTTVQKGTDFFSQLAGWQMMLLIATPIIIIIIIFVVTYITGSMGDRDSDIIDETGTPRKKTKQEKQKEKEQAKVVEQEKKQEKKQGRRMQIAITLLDHKQIAREGALSTDYYLRSIEGANKGEIFKISKYVSTIGRRSRDGRLNDIELSSFEKNISREQALLVYKKDEETFYLINQSDVPMKVNKDRMNGAYPLLDGDRIYFGGSAVILQFSRGSIFSA
jgi:hypothetical protein